MFQDGHLKGMPGGGQGHRVIPAWRPCVEQGYRVDNEGPWQVADRGKGGHLGTRRVGEMSEGWTPQGMAGGGQGRSLIPEWQAMSGIGVQGRHLGACKVGDKGTGWTLGGHDRWGK